MTVTDAMQAIDSDRISALTNLASNVKTFLRIAAGQPEIHALLGILANNPAAASQVSAHALELTAAPADPDREHPADAALAVYLWLLGNHAPEFGALATAILREDGRFFWARRLAEQCRAPAEPMDWDGSPAKSTPNGAAAPDARVSPQES